MSQVLDGAEGDVRVSAVRHDRVPEAALLCGGGMLRGGAGK